MRSIRQSLAKWLVLWISLLWAISGIGVYSALKAGLESNLDRNLEMLADKAVVADQSGEEGVGIRFVPVGVTIPATNPGVLLFEPGSNFYYQAWDASSGRMVAQSNNLSTGPLSWRHVDEGQRLLWDDRLSGVGAVRAIGLPIRRRPPSEREAHRRPSGEREAHRRPHSEREAVRLNLVIANDRAFVDGRLGQLVVTLLIASLCGVITTWVIVKTVVKRGLMPLNDLGNQLSGIKPQHFQLQLLSEELPVELLPVSRALVELVERMEKSFERERRFSGDVAHEFRTPIAELRAMAEVAIRWPHRASADDYQEVLSISVQMEELIEALLELSRVEGGSVTKDFSQVSLQAEILKCWDPYSEKAAAKHIELFCDVAESVVVNTSAGMLDLILKNLLENAVEYSPEGEQIMISLEMQEDQAGWLTVANLAPSLQLADVDHLFERFWRGDDSRTSVRHTGLGLSLAYSCARSMAMDLGASLNDTRELTIRLGRFSVESGR